MCLIVEMFTRTEWPELSSVIKVGGNIHIRFHNLQYNARVQVTLDIKKPQDLDTPDDFFRVHH